MGINEELFERAAKTIPGGVNSPVRALKALAGPLALSSVLRALTCGMQKTSASSTTSALGAQ